MFDTIIEVSKEILPRSHKLTVQYIEMDLKLREFEKKHEGQSSSEIDSERNLIKQPYETL